MNAVLAKDQGSAWLEPQWHRAAEDAPVFIPAHPVYSRMIRAVPPHILHTFTAEQLRWLAIASTPTPSQHLIQYRASVFFQRFYLTIFIGRENRDTARLRKEGQLSVLRRMIAYYFAMFCSVAVTLVAGIACLYAVKSILGINLMVGHSFLHDVLY